MNAHAHALIAGSSGLVGRLLLDELLASNNYDKVITLVRKPLLLKHRKLVQIETNFSDDWQSLLRPYSFEHVFCTLGTTMKKAGSKQAFRNVDYDLPIALAKLAIEKKVKCYSIVSSVGANLNSPFFYLKVKGEIERDLQALGFQKLNILRPAILLGTRGEKRLLEGVSLGALKGLSYFMVGPLKRQCPIEAKVVAQVMFNTAVEKLKPLDSTTIIESEEIQSLFDCMQEQ